MKKIFLFIIPLLLLSACGKQAMDLPAKDGTYEYENFDYNFVVTLPEEFMYYQTQRKASESWTDVEFFIPSNDTNYYQEVHNYWMPLVIRVWDENEYAATLVAGAEPAFKSFGTKRGYTYTYLFEKSIPEDWQDRWNQDIERFIVDNLKIK